jgi:anti-sigma regulatory factor (Ser/Thr protein kinase)
MIAIRNLGRVAADCRQERSEFAEVIGDCKDVGAAAGTLGGDCTETMEFSFVLPNDQGRVSPVIEFLATEAARVAEADPAEQMRIGLALEEAVANALYHGNLEIHSNDANTEQMCRHDLAQLRRRQEPFCNRRIRIVAMIAPEAAVFVVRDDGCGFDPRELADPTDEANLERPCGRGVFLMRNLMDEVRFNMIGNEVTLVRRWVA